MISTICSHIYANHRSGNKTKLGNRDAYQRNNRYNQQKSGHFLSSTRRNTADKDIPLLKGKRFSRGTGMSRPINSASTPSVTAASRRQ
ncbi:hypothetical protein [Azospirillum sp. B510]|uniref:hypothetical protein n=1 Tax=Azospirillum sp. (strain B510) TaxID=137722 RepID=UPI0013908FC4|nr:hypothetical protein [Azospirillum sp. B510]